MNSKRLYEKIDRLREDKGWSVNYLSTQAGISHSTLHSWKARETTPSIEVLEALCDALQISLAQLFSGSDCGGELPEENIRLLEYWSTLTRRKKDLVMELIGMLRGSS